MGSEIIRVRRVEETNTLDVVAYEKDTGRGLRDSAPIIHLDGEPVSDDAAIFFARFKEEAGGVVVSTSAPRAMFVFRYDPNAPGVPGVPKPQSGENPTSYDVKWDRALQEISGVAYYEIQERGGASDDLQANVVWRPLSFVRTSRAPSYYVGASLEFPGESPRPEGQFFSYRVRAVSNAGVVSSWGVQTSPMATGGSFSILTGVSNYPNPFDSRKGGVEGHTTITYVLGEPAKVSITIYDLLGYVVKEFSESSTPPATGQKGPNFVEWDGTNGLGNKVSKGGYIARIKVVAPGGSKVAVRKIGVIH